MSSDPITEVLTQHVEADGSLENSIEELSDAGDRVLYLPGGAQATGKELADELRSWRPEYVLGDTTVYHATDRETADFVLENGFIQQMKPWTLASERYSAGEYAEFAPGAGVERGVYVGAGPSIVSGFGPVVLELKVPYEWLEVPAELTSLGHDSPSGALWTEHGAVIKRSVHPYMIREYGLEDREEHEGIPYEEVQSDLFRESGANVTDEDQIEEYVEAMEDYNGWGDFPPVHGGYNEVDEQDLEDWEEAVEGGYEHELVWSRPLEKSDLGTVYAVIEDGHHRAYAASRLGIPIRMRVWE